MLHWSQPLAREGGFIMGKEVDPIQEFATQSSIARNTNNNRATRLEAAHKTRRLYKLLNKQGRDHTRDQIMEIIQQGLR